MKITILFSRQVLLSALLLICFQFKIYSQETDSLRVNKPGLFVGLSFGPSQTQITNEGLFSGAELQSDKQSSFTGSAEVGYYFSKNIGLSSGIGYSSYKTDLKLNAHQSNFSTTDSENEAYESRVTGSDIKETQDISFVSVPVCLNIRLPFSKTFGFILQTGVDLAMPIIKKYTSSGTFTYKGYYQAYNVLLENLPAYGFPSNQNTIASGEMEIKSLNVNAIASAGFDFFIQKNIQVAVAASYFKSLSNISSYTSPTTFQLSSDVDQINSLMGGSSKVSLESMGFKISLRYYFKAR